MAAERAAHAAITGATPLSDNDHKVPSSKPWSRAPSSQPSQRRTGDNHE
jgi:hypothetical protein